MEQATKVDKVGNVLPVSYRPDAVERVGRRLKMEYVGMASVFLFIWLVDFRGAADWRQSTLATAGSFFLFLGLKKKTRDHLVTSFLLFAAAALAQPAVTAWGWALPYMLFGACSWAMEGYLEKRRNRIYALPVIFAAFGWSSLLWPLAFAFIAAYLLEPREDLPGLRRRLATLVGASGVAAIAGSSLRLRSGDPLPHLQTPPDVWLLGVFAAVAVPALLALTVYWKGLAAPHRMNGVLFTALAPFDDRLVAMFGVSAAIVLAATLFRQSADSLSWRPVFKHAEWYFFWVVLATAVGLLVRT